MELKVKAVAGTIESSDIQIIVEPHDSGVEIILESVVIKQYGEDIKKVIEETIKEFGVTSAKVYANDKGAITPVIRSKVQTAVYRALELKKYMWN